VTSLVVTSWLSLISFAVCMVAATAALADGAVAAGTAWTADGELLDVTWLGSDALVICGASGSYGSTI
jgi:hypothetical protein